MATDSVSKGAKRRKIWQIEDVDDATRRKIRAYAALKGISVHEALEQIVKLAKI